MMNDPAQTDIVARNRFIIICLARLSGVILLAVGVLVVNKTINLPDIAGYLLIALGVVELFVVPQILVKRWRSPEE